MDNPQAQGQMQALAPPHRPGGAYRGTTPTQTTQDVLNFMRTTLVSAKRVGGEGPEYVKKREVLITNFINSIDESVFCWRFQKLYEEYPRAFQYVDETIEGKEKVTALLFDVCVHMSIHRSKIAPYVYDNKKTAQWIDNQWEAARRRVRVYYREEVARYNEMINALGDPGQGGAESSTDSTADTHTA